MYLTLALVLGCNEAETLSLSDSNNFQYDADVSMESSELPSAVGTSVVEWSGLGADMLGNPMDPTDVVGVQLLVFPDMDLDEVSKGVATDTLKQSDVGVFLEAEPTGTQVELQDFGLQGNPVGVDEYFLEGSGTWMLSLVGAEQYLRFHHLVPMDDSVETTASITGDAAQIGVTATFAGVVAVSAEHGAVDWSDITADGLDNELALHRLDSLTLARVPGVSPADIEASFDALDSLIDVRHDYELDGQTSLELPELAEVDDEGTWLLGLSCSSCTSPVPKVLVVVEPE